MRRSKWTCLSVQETGKRPRRQDCIRNCANSPTAWHCWFSSRLFTISNSLNREQNGSRKRRNSDCNENTESENIFRTITVERGTGRWTLKLVLFCLAVLCYANSYDGDFVFDDTEAIVNNKDVTRAWRGDRANPLVQTGTNERGANKDGFWSLIENDFWGTPLGSNTSHKSWRPLTTFTFR